MMLLSASVCPIALSSFLRCDRAITGARGPIVMIRVYRIVLGGSLSTSSEQANVHGKPYQRQLNSWMTLRSHFYCEHIDAKAREG